MPYPYEETKIHIRCALSNKPEIVYVRSLVYQDIHLEEFNGCDNDFHNCHECNVICNNAAMEKFHQLAAEGPPPWMHMP